MLIRLLVLVILVIFMFIFGRDESNEYVLLVFFVKWIRLEIYEEKCFIVFVLVFVVVCDVGVVLVLVVYRENLICFFLLMLLMFIFGN